MGGQIPLIGVDSQWRCRNHTVGLKIGLQHKTSKGNRWRGARENAPEPFTPNKVNPAGLTCDYTRRRHVSQAASQGCPSWGGWRALKLDPSRATRTTGKNLDFQSAEDTGCKHSGLAAFHCSQSFPTWWHRPGLGINRGARCAPRMHVCKVPISKYTVIGLPEGPYLTFGLQVAGQSSASAVNPSLTHFTQPESKLTTALITAH